MSERVYHTHLGRVLGDGILRIPTSACAEDGAACDGEAEVGTDHPCYANWLAAIADKERHFAALREERVRAREERRQAADQRRLDRWD